MASNETDNNGTELENSGPVWCFDMDIYIKVLANKNYSAHMYNKYQTYKNFRQAPEKISLRSNNFQLSIQWLVDYFIHHIWSVGFICSHQTGTILTILHV